MHRAILGFLDFPTSKVWYVRSDMGSTQTNIEHVSDTALWVAHFRALETERPQALFRDPLAARLAGTRGGSIAATMRPTSRYTQWTVTIRTWVIDRYLKELIGDGADTVINLGAGLDTRPYRLSLAKSVRWIEVDYPHVIELKERELAGETPTVSLERVKLDLADEKARQALFRRLGNESKKAVVLTEGVIPYLTEEQVAALARDLKAEPSFRFWIAEYISPLLYRYFQSAPRRQAMKNAPFVFFPEDWMRFFAGQGWTPREVRYLSEEAAKIKRPMPLPWWALFYLPFMWGKRGQQARRRIGYVVFERK
jgi:methyltransferase (TIGR00027 family)